MLGPFRLVGKVLRKYPLPGNIALGGSIMLGADCYAQNLQATQLQQQLKLDYRRMAVMTSWVCCCVVPARYFVIRFWDRTLRNYGSFAKGLATNQTLTLCLLPLFMTTSTISYNLLSEDSHSLGEIQQKVKTKLSHDLVPSWLACTLFWTPVHSINFYFIPPLYRVLFASCAQFFSNTFLSYMQFGGLLDLIRSKWRRFLQKSTRTAETAHIFADGLR